MAQDIGRIEKPSVEHFGPGRKLYFVPLIFSARESESELAEMINRYWDQAETHLGNLEEKLSKVTKVFHELVPEGSTEQGASVVEELSSGSHRIVKSRLDNGAELAPIEEPELLAEFMDWSRCLAIGLQSPKAADRVYESYIEAHKARTEHIAKRLDETLKEDDTGLLLMREGHQVQYPSDVQVFYVSPPTLDEIKRWVRARESEAATARSE